MGQGYKAAPRNDISPIVNAIDGVSKRASRLETPTGTSLANLVAKVQAALDNLNAQVVTLVNAAIAANSYTQTQINNLVANPGNIAPGDVTASGRVTSNGAPLTSIASFNYQVTHGYVSAWINDDGQLGFSPSTGAVKVDLVEMTPANSALLKIKPYWGRYEWDEPDSPLKAFVLAEDVAAAGFGPDVAPTDADGRPFTVNYSQLVPSIIADLIAKQRQIDDLLAYTGLDTTGSDS